MKRKNSKNSIKERYIAPSKDVMVSVHGVQNYSEEGKDNIKITTSGRLHFLPNGYRIEYKETEMTGWEGCQTSVDISPEQVILTRSGDVKSQMVFSEGTRNVSLYSTPYGDLEVGISTDKIKSSIGEKGGELDLKYTVDVDCKLSSINYLRLKVVEKNNII